MKDFPVWKSRLSELSEDQVTELLQSLKLLNKLPNKPFLKQTGFREESDWLFDGIYLALKRAGWVSDSTRYRLLSTKSYGIYKRDAPAVMKQLEKLLPEGPGQHRAKTTLAYLVGNALVLWVKRRKKMPQKATTVVKFVTRAVEAIEGQFPGYIAANLFHLVIGGINGQSVRSNQRASSARIRRVARG